MGAITKGQDGFYHPANEDEVRQLILLAKKSKWQIRVRGSAHSVQAAIFTDDFGKKNAVAGIDIIMDKMDAVSFDEANNQVTAEAGCHLGRDPYDPTGKSNLQDSLLYKLNERGFSIPDTGGIIHQTVGGFIATGSSGGSLQDSFGEVIVAIRLIDGNGETHTFSRAKKDDGFYAAGVSMGLLGIVTQVTFSYQKKFDIIGQQSTTTYEDCEVDLFGESKNGKPQLPEYFKKTQYTRILWWPQAKVERVVNWKAHKMTKADYNQQTGSEKDFKPNPYLEFPKFHSTELPAESAGGLWYSVVGNWHLGIKYLNPGWLLKLGLKFIAWLYPKHILPALLNEFMPLDKENNPPGPVKFWDVWWSGLPMDNRVDDKLMPTKFTEIWIPLEKATEVMRKMRDLYERNGQKATGSYSCEIYAAKSSDFWLSPSYGGDRVRVDIFWFGYNESSPAQNYYPQFWDMLMADPDLHCRFHWGKFMPLNPQYISKQYPKWNDFMALREKMDPDGIFITKYWRDRLGLS